MRRLIQGYLKDSLGNIIQGASYYVYKTGTTNEANIYTTLTSSTPATQPLTTDASGKFSFYVSDFDYGSTQLFDIYFPSPVNTTFSSVKGETILTTYNITSNTTVSYPIKVPYGVIFDISSGVTLTFNSQVEIGKYQAFSGPGTVSFTSGSEVKVSWFSSLSTAISMLGSNNINLIIDTNQTVSANLTIPSNILLKVLKGNTLSISFGVTLTINGPFEAGLYQVFSGDGDVSFGLGSVAEVYPEWWCENTAPGTTDMSSALTKAGQQIYAKVSLSPGMTYRVKSTVSCKTSIDGNGATITAYGETGFVSDPTSGHLIVLLMEGDGLSAIPDLASDVTKGDVSLTFTSDPGLSVGDIICIYNPTDYSYSGFRSYYRAGEYAIVESVSGTTVTLRHPVYASYTATSVDIYKLSAISVKVRDLTIIGIAKTATYCDNLVLRYTRDSVVENVKNEYFTYNGIDVTQSVNVTINNCESHGILSNPAGDIYPLSINNSQHITVNNGFYTSSYWHAISTGGGSQVGCVPCRDIKIQGCTLRSYNESVGYHGNTEYFWLTNNKIFGAVGIAGNYGIIQGNSIYQVRNQQITFQASELSGMTHSILDNEAITESDFITDRGVVLDIGGNSHVFGSNSPNGGSFTFSRNKVILNAVTSTTNPSIRIRNHGYAGSEHVHIDISNNEIIIPDTSVYSGGISIETISGNNFDLVSVKNNILNGGIDLRYVNESYIFGNKITQIYQYGVLVLYADYTKIIDNNISYCRYVPIYINNITYAAEIFGNTMENCNLVDGVDPVFNSAIAIYHANKVYVYGNILRFPGLYMSRKIFVNSVYQIMLGNNKIDGPGNLTYYDTVDSSNFSTASPTKGDWIVGDICWNESPSAGSPPGWICIFKLSTTLTDGEPTGETNMAVASGTGTANGYPIGVVLDNGTVHWTTIASGGGTTTLVLTVALPGDAAAGNAVYVMRWAAMANLT